MTSPTHDAKWLSDLAVRLVHFIQSHGAWFWGDTPTEIQWVFRADGLLFYMIQDGSRQSLFVQTEPLDASVVYYSLAWPERTNRHMIETRVLPIVDRLMVLDDLAAA